MYFLAEYNYEKAENQVLYVDSFNNCLNGMEDEAHKYIINNGGLDKNIKYDELVYDYDKEPNRNRQLLVSEYYVKKSKHNLNKITVRRKIKHYGILFNSYIIKNMCSYQVIKFIDFSFMPHINVNFEKKYEYKFDSSLSKLHERFKKENYFLTDSSSSDDEIISDSSDDEINDDNKSEPVNIIN